MFRQHEVGEVREYPLVLQRPVQEVPGSLRPEPADLLGKFPLSVPNAKGGKTYYLVSGMPHPSPWMTTAIASG